MSDELGEDDAETVFDEVAVGRAEQAVRHGDHIDPDHGRTAYSATTGSRRVAPRRTESPE